MFTIFTVFRPKPRSFFIYFYPALGLKTAKTKGNFFTKLSSEEIILLRAMIFTMLNMKCI